MKTWVTRILLAFAIFTLGFGVGKEVGMRKVAAAAPADAGGAGAPGENKVIVYYLHATFRCVTCNKIETMVRQLVETEFDDAVAAGRVEWREADFQAREDLAKRYDVATSSVVVVKVRDGKDVEFHRLDNVWTLSDKPVEFGEYVAGAIRKYLD